MTLTDIPFRIMRKVLHIDRKVYEDWIFSGDPSVVHWKKLGSNDQALYPFPKEDYINELADVVFSGFEYREETHVWKYYDSQDTTEAEALSYLQHESLFKTPVEEIVFNALLWGNRKDPKLPVHIEVFEGAEGRILRVTDAGDGFDYRKKVQQLLESEKYWQNEGNGLRNLAHNPCIQVSYDNPGNYTNMQVWFQQGISQRSIGTYARRNRPKRSIASSILSIAVA